MLNLIWGYSGSLKIFRLFICLRMLVLYAMGWLAKIFKGSKDKISGGQYRGRYEDDTIWEVPTTSEDTGPDFDREEIDRAMALSIAEEDEKEKKTIGINQEPIFKGSKHKISGGQYRGRYEDDTIWEVPTTSEDTGPDFDREEIDRAMALSITEEDEKEKKILGINQEPIFKGSKHKISGGQYRGRYEDDTIWEVPTTSEDTGPDFDRVEIDRAMALSIAEEDEKEKKTIGKESHLEEDEHLAKAIQESLYVEPPPQSPPRAPPTRPPGYDLGSFFPHNVFRYPLGRRICSGCKSEIGNDRFFSGMGAFWHPECFRCHACNQPISDHEFSMSDGRPYHKSCYKDLYHPKCDVCKQFIPSDASGEIAYREHPFWQQKYCPSHENDGTPRCSSCERMEQVDCRYLVLDDGRKLCLECLDSSIMDTHECQPLYLEIQEFYEGLNMKVEQQIPMLLVERQALNEAMEGEKIGHHHMPETRGLCLSEEQTIRTISRRPRIGGYRIIDMFTEPYRLIRRCEVTAILVLFGLPRLLTGSILAHEMMHAWLRLKGYPSLSPDVEEGICQVLAHMWLDSEIIPCSSNEETSTSSSEVSNAIPPGSSKKGKRSQFEKKLGGFFKDQIEANPSVAYGDGFRQGNKAVLEFGLKRTLDHIRLTGSFPS